MRKSYVDASVYEVGLERAATAFNLFDHVVVMFSGGKDSTSTLHVMIEAARALGKLPIHVMHYDEEAIPYETDEYMRRVNEWPEIELEWLCAPVEHRNACSRKNPYWYPWAPEDRDLWCRPPPPEGIFAEDISWADFVNKENRPTTEQATPMRFTDAAKYGRVGIVFGFRTQESLRRFRVVTAKKEDNFITGVTGGSGNCSNVYPIYDWTTDDVWTAPKKLGWDYNRAYDAMDKAGVPPHAQRCSPPFGEEPLERLWTYQSCFPELWDKMTKRVNGAATAARYARTPLWAYRGLPPKHEIDTWPEFVRGLVEKWPEPYRSEIRNRVRALVNQHYGKTTDPIVSGAVHPLSGVSWEFLAKIALRGDFKGRKTPVLMYKDDPRAWEKYRKACEKYI